MIPIFDVFFLGVLLAKSQGIQTFGDFSISKCMKNLKSAAMAVSGRFLAALRRAQFFPRSACQWWPQAVEPLTWCPSCCRIGSSCWTARRGWATTRVAVERCGFLRNIRSDTDTPILKSIGLSSTVIKKPQGCAILWSHFANSWHANCSGGLQRWSSDGLGDQRWMTRWRTCWWPRFCIWPTRRGKEKKANFLVWNSQIPKKGSFCCPLGWDWCKPWSATQLFFFFEISAGPWNKMGWPSDSALTFQRMLRRTSPSTSTLQVSLLLPGIFQNCGKLSYFLTTSMTQSHEANVFPYGISFV